MAARVTKIENELVELIVSLFQPHRRRRMKNKKNETGKPKDELTDGALEKVSGGDIHFTKPIDKSSPV
jgi:type VI protein secretion system component Hcp